MYNTENIISVPIQASNMEEFRFRKYTIGHLMAEILDNIDTRNRHRVEGILKGIAIKSYDDFKEMSETVNPLIKGNLLYEDNKDTMPFKEYTYLKALFTHQPYRDNDIESLNANELRLIFKMISRIAEYYEIELI